MKVKIKSSNHLLSAFIHQSQKSNSNNLAIILPGFLESKDYPHLIKLGKDLAKRGFTAVRFDPTGVWDSEGDIKAYTVSQYLKDIEIVVGFMKKRNQRNYDKIIILGHSLGGMMAMLYGAKNKTIDAVVGIMPPPSQTSPKGFQETLKQWQKDKKKVSYRVLPKHKDKEKKFTVPYSYIIDSQKYDVRKLIAKFKKPLLLIAGELDDKIMSEEIKKIYTIANEPKKFILLKGIDHDYRLDKKMTETVNACILEFLKKEIPSFKGGI